MPEVPGAAVANGEAAAGVGAAGGAAGAAASNAAGALGAGALGTGAMGGAVAPGRANEVTLAACDPAPGALATDASDGAGLANTCVAACEATATGMAGIGAVNVVERLACSASAEAAGVASTTGVTGGRPGARGAPGNCSTAMVAVCPDVMSSELSSRAAGAAARAVVVGCLPAASA